MIGRPPRSPLFPSTTLFRSRGGQEGGHACAGPARPVHPDEGRPPPDRKSTRLNSSHRTISDAAFCLKKKKRRFLLTLLRLRRSATCGELSCVCAAGLVDVGYSCGYSVARGALGTRVFLFFL